MPYRKIVAAAYDAGVEEEFCRLTSNPLRETEFRLITELMDEYIPGSGTIIDIGSGPGRYAEYLLKRNCRVGLVDLSALSLKAFSERIQDSDLCDKILFNRVSCATQLDWIDNSSADAILLMGPMYHLVNEDHRNITLTHCRRILKPGGFLFSVFLSPFPALFNTQEFSGQELLFSNWQLYKHIQESTTTHTHFQGFDVPQFRCWPQYAWKILNQSGFKIVRTRNIEGIGSFYPDTHWDKQMTKDEKESLTLTLRNSSECIDKLGITHQYISIARTS
ncbi:MAG: class I SAM-dependent methyltransferase [Bacteroidales bacterium]